MGIPSYFSHFVRQHRAIIKQINRLNKPINNLYLDCNAFIYDGVNNDRANLDEDILIKFVCDKLIYYISLLKPNKKVFIAFDGVAPVAKLDQQRKRRYLSWYQNNYMKEHNGTSTGTGTGTNTGTSTSTGTWNTSAITPGTLFMDKLTKEIKKRFNNASAFGLAAFIISGADEIGEGEHKIFSYIRDNAEYHRDTNTVIYGLDADLIMLTLSHLNISKNLYLFRETPEFIKSIDNTLNPNELYLLDIPEFGKRIILDFSDGFDTTTSSFQKDDLNKINDYVFIFFLLGNDFMPHFPALNIRTTGIDLLLNAYKLCINSKKLFLTNDTKIIWQNLRVFIEYLSVNEFSYIKQEYATRDKMKKYTSNNNNNKKPLTAQQEMETKLINLPTTDRVVEKYINPDETGWEARYYRVLFDISSAEEERTKEICLNYLEGLEWTFKYYKSDCVDWRWTYKYDYPPLLVDLLKYIPYFETDFFIKTSTRPVTSIVQLSYVLPKQSLYLIPNNVGALLLENKAELYVPNCRFQWAFCKYFWECHVKLPVIDILELEEFVKEKNINNN
jgi:5'-3' exonuclease